MAALKAVVEATRQIKKGFDDEAHAEQLRREEYTRFAQKLELDLVTSSRIKAESDERVSSPTETHMTVRTIWKGDESNTPLIGDLVSVSYSGLFAEGTTHLGVTYDGQQYANRPCPPMRPYPIGRLCATPLDAGSQRPLKFQGR